MLVCVEKDRGRDASRWERLMVRDCIWWRWDSELDGMRCDEEGLTVEDRVGFVLCRDPFCKIEL
jgi:hypothetical protein